MATARICPKCGSIVVPVPEIPVRNFLKDQFLDELPKDVDWYICPNQECSVSYFTDGMIFTVHDLNMSLWFKDKGQDVPICYCAGITRKDILKAVCSGHTNIKDIRNYLDKNLPCDCKKLNPLGGCCCEAFNYEIELAKIK